MIHRHRGNRRLIKATKIAKRERMIKALGIRQGTIYDKHIEKVEKSGGYMAKHGNYSHYGCLSRNAVKTRDSNRYGKNEIWRRSDQRRIDSMSDGIDTYNKGYRY